MRVSRWPDEWQLHAIQLLAVPGLLVAFFLLLYHEGYVINACSPSGWDDCGRVSGPDAPYSSIGPIPVALIGLVGYAAIFLALWLRDWISWIDVYIPEIIMVLTGFALLFSLGLTLLELFVIHYICRYCVVSAFIVLLMFVLAISYIRSSGEEES